MSKLNNNQLENEITKFYRQPRTAKEFLTWLKDKKQQRLSERAAATVNAEIELAEMELGLR